MCRGCASTLRRLVLVNGAEHILVHYDRVALAQSFNPRFLELLLIVGNNQFAHVVVCLRSLQLLAVCSRDWEVFHVSHSSVLSEHHLVDERVVALAEDALYDLDAYCRVVELLAQTLSPFSNGMFFSDFFTASTSPSCFTQ